MQKFFLAFKEINILWLWIACMALAFMAGYFSHHMENSALRAEAIYYQVKYNDLKKIFEEGS